MNICFQDLFSLRVTHAYYAGDCGDVGFLIPAESAVRMNNMRLIGKIIESRLRVMYEADATGVALVRGDPQTLRLGLHLRNPFFHNITSGAVDARSRVLIYQNAGADSRQLAPPVHAIPVAGTLRHAITKPERPVVVALSGPLGDSQRVSVTDAEQVSAAFELSNRPAGLYRLEEQYPAGPEPTTPYYFDRELVAAGAFAIVEITIDGGLFTRQANFEIAFAARSERLSYFVSARGFSAPAFAQLTVTDAGFAEEGRERVSFSRIEAGDFGPSDLPASILGDPEARVVLFRSQSPVTRRQAARRRIQLGRNGEVLVEHLPQPSASKADADMLVFLTKT